MTPEQRLPIRAELARRMGWTVNGCYAIAPEGTDLNVLCPRGRLYGYPDPFTNAEDNRALVAWLAADDARWLAFRKEILLCWAVLPDDVALSHGYYEKWFLTLPYETITLAAARALGIPEASE